MAGKALSFAVILSVLTLAAGSRSPANADDQVLALPLQSSSATATNDNNECVYTIYVQTGWIWKGGTDSVVGVSLHAADGSGVRIPDLAKWGGLMGAGHDYYERGNLDIFSGRGPCMRAAPCAMNLTSDGSGAHHGWYCKSVEVTVAGHRAACAGKAFGVDQWLARDAPPYRLYAERNLCAKSDADAEE